ncbi:unnamed protein product [Cylicocyclus nassatus]|uniref:Uncharacterized protein n=1 Tax=Cylicocyclus nassatus TaxID=53992 RepID=A0AA36DU49_CYLNA|nr:unnamed protein product [Cylicocyclus nassatus]
MHECTLKRQSLIPMQYSYLISLNEIHESRFSRFLLTYISANFYLLSNLYSDSL